MGKWVCCPQSACPDSGLLVMCCRSKKSPCRATIGSLGVFMRKKKWSRVQGRQKSSGSASGLGLAIFLAEYFPAALALVSSCMDKTYQNALAPDSVGPGVWRSPRRRPFRRLPASCALRAEICPALDVGQRAGCWEREAQLITTASGYG